MIGAGNTAIDAANAAKRLGARNVSIVYRRGKEEMPAFPFEYEHALREGVVFLWHMRPTEIIAGANGRTTSLLCAQADGSEFRLEVDMVIPAIGQSRLAG